MIEAAGTQESLDVASALVAEGGVLVIAGYHQDGPRQVDLQSWNWRGIDVVNAHERQLSRQIEGIAEAARLRRPRRARPRAALHPRVRGRAAGARRSRWRGSGPPGSRRRSCGREHQDAPAPRVPGRGLDRAPADGGRGRRRCVRGGRHRRPGAPGRPCDRSTSSCSSSSTGSSSRRRARCMPSRRSPRWSEGSRCSARSPSAAPQRRRRRWSMPRRLPTDCSTSTSPTGGAMRWSPAGRRIADGAIGEVFAVDCAFHNAYAPGKDWSWDPALAGGGCVIDLGVHLVDLVRFVLDFPAVAGVTSRTRRHGGGAVEDYAVATLDLANGAVATLACSWNLPLGRPADFRLTFYGTTGAVAVANCGDSYTALSCEIWRGTSRERLVEPSEGWEARALCAWSERLARGERYDPARPGARRERSRARCDRGVCEMRMLMTADAVGGVWGYALELAAGLAGCGVGGPRRDDGPRPLTRAGRRGRLGAREHAPPRRLRPRVGARSVGRRRARRGLAAGARRRARARCRPSERLRRTPRCRGALRSSSSATPASSRGTRRCAASSRSHAAAYRDAVTRGIRAADALVAPTAAMLAQLDRLYRPRCRRLVIHNGREQQQFGACDKEPFVLGMGRLWDEAKNLAALEHAAAAISWPVLLAGDAGSASSSSARLLGQLGAREIRLLLARAALFASPARYEPFGLAALEAGLSGCGLVLGDIPSLREVWAERCLLRPARRPRRPRMAARAPDRRRRRPHRPARGGRATGPCATAAGG